MRLVATCWATHWEALCSRVERAAAVLRAARAPAGGQGHLIEARLDLLAEPPPAGPRLARLARAASGRLLATCRSGGPGAPQAEADRKSLLVQLASVGAAVVDLEQARDEEGPARHALPGLPGSVQLLLSLHLDAPPPDGRQGLLRLAARLAARHPDIVKLAVPVRDVVEAQSVALAGAALPSGIAWAPVALGPAGAWLRLLGGRPGPLAGRAWADLGFFAFEESLPLGRHLGQLDLADALVTHAVDEVTTATRVFAVGGWPLNATWSPSLHGQLFRRRQADALLVPLPVERAEDLAGVLAALDVAGAAITAPHKRAALGLAAPGPPNVTRVGAANSWRREADGSGSVEAFDGSAAAEAFEAAAGPLRGTRVLVLGAGGAASCVAAEFVARGARIELAARRPAEAEPVARAAGASVRAFEAARESDAEILVNATPLGSVGAAALPLEGLPWASLRAVMDLVTTPPHTVLLAEAKRRGLAAVDGLGMLARQAAAQQDWWGALPGKDTSALARPPLPALETEALLRRLVAERGEA